MRLHTQNDLNEFDKLSLVTTSKFGLSSLGELSDLIQQPKGSKKLKLGRSPYKQTLLSNDQIENLKTLKTQREIKANYTRIKGKDSKQKFDLNVTLDKYLETHRPEILK